MKIKLTFFGLFFCSGLFFCCAPLKKTNGQLDTAFDTSPAFSQSFAGLAVYDPIKHKMLYAHNADRYFTPASNTKLFTFYTGLMILGDSVRGLTYYTAQDSLIFKGTGDPSLLNPDLPASDIIQFLRKRKEKLFYLPPANQEPYFGPGWSWDDYNDYYSVERSPFPIYANRVTFTQPKPSPLPKAFPAYFQPKLSVDSTMEISSNRIKRNIATNDFAVPSRDRDQSFYQEVPIKYSTPLFMELLSDTLQRNITPIDHVPNSFAGPRIFFSIPSDSMYKRMLMVSDNFIAEQILLLAASKITDTLKTSIAIDYMQEHFLKDLPDRPVWVDGSGLSRYNLFTPRTLVRLLEKIKNKVGYEKLFNFLPKGGSTGTLKNYFTSNEPYIFAKTGSLSNNYSLSGFLKTKSGKILIFSFMNSNYTVPTSDLKKGMEKILVLIRDNY